VVVERGGWTSYSACGIPYWVAGDVSGAEELVARTPEQHRANGIDVRLRTEAVQVDLAPARSMYEGVDSGETERLTYDQLMIATGPGPYARHCPASTAAGSTGVQTLDDGTRLLDALCRRSGRCAGRWWSAAGTSGSSSPRRCTATGLR
jgi:NADPH-dependent 2,4-dienoyl-CoA reductase/sulfur reductase-like enzyme